MPGRSMLKKGTRSVVLLIGLGTLLPVRPTEAEGIDVLEVTVGKPTTLSSLTYQNSATVAVSRTGVVAAFYPKPGKGALPVRLVFSEFDLTV